MGDAPKRSSLSGADLAAGRLLERFVPPPAPPRDDALESLPVWGFRDTAFRVLPNGSVILTGDRYSLCGAELPDILPWMETKIGLRLDPRDQNPSAYPPSIPAPRVNAGFLEDVRKFLDDGAMTDDAEIRLRHGHGHTQEEMWAIKYGRLARVPDLVVYPESEERGAARSSTLARAPRRLPDPVRRRHERDRRAALPARTSERTHRVGRPAAHEPRSSGSTRRTAWRASRPARSGATSSRQLAPPRLHDRPRARQHRVLDARRLDRDPRERHEEEPLRQHRGHRASTSTAVTARGELARDAAPPARVGRRRPRALAASAPRAASAS